MKKTMAVLLLGASLCGIAAGARADDAAPVQKAVTIKLGVFIPGNGNIKDAFGKTWFSAGADYAFNKQGTGQSIMPLAYVDYAGASRHGLQCRLCRRRGRRARVRLPPGASTIAPYFGAGVGAYFIHGSGNGGSTNDTRLGGKVNIGVEFQQMYLLEANYTYAGKVSGTTVDGFGIQAGVRF